MFDSTALFIAEVEGGLFDINATLPLMAVQFLILAVILNATFFKPLGTAIDERDGYIRSNQTDARERLAQAEQLAKQYAQDVSATRRQAQEVIANAQAEAQKIAAQKLAEAQQEAQVMREQAQKELNQEQEVAFAALEQQVESLSHQVLDKVLGVAA